MWGDTDSPCDVLWAYFPQSEPKRCWFQRRTLPKSPFARGAAFIVCWRRVFPCHGRATDFRAVLRTILLGGITAA
jgi:hypothetical protein